MLCTVSDLYKVNRRYEDAKELLYMAYERNPESRTILYSALSTGPPLSNQINVTFSVS